MKSEKQSGSGMKTDKQRERAGIIRSRSVPRSSLGDDRSNAYFVRGVIKSKTLNNEKDHPGISRMFDNSV